MSIADKQVLMAEMEKKLGSRLTVDGTAAAMSILADVLVGYDAVVVPGDENDSEELIQAYMEAKEIEGCSKLTLDRYGYTLRKMLRVTGVPVRRITVYHLRNFLMGLRKEGIADSTLGTYRYALCSFFGWLKREGLLKENPCDNLARIRCAKKIRLPFTDEEIERLKECCRQQRERAMICFLLSTGCRISEVCRLNRTDVDFQNLECIVLGKGNKERKVYLDEIAALHLKRYLASRNDISPALFAGKGTDRIKPDSVRQVLHRIEKTSGIENIHPHRFRRTLATNLISRGMAIQEVSAILGHDRIDTTMKYIYIRESTIKNSYRKYA